MLSHESQNFAHVPRNGRLRKIPKKVQEFCLHLSLTGPILGQRNDDQPFQTLEDMMKLSKLDWKDKAKHDAIIQEIVMTHRKNEPLR